jgi:hypothetical protein
MEDVDNDDDDPVGRRMHTTPRSAIADLVEDLREQGWFIELEEDETGTVMIFAKDRAATEEWPN